MGETVDRLEKDIAANHTQGQVWVASSDFEGIARRNGITSRDAPFHMASQVAASIASSVAKP